MTRQRQPPPPPPPPLPLTTSTLSHLAARFVACLPMVSLAICVQRLGTLHPLGPTHAKLVLLIRVINFAALRDVRAAWQSPLLPSRARRGRTSCTLRSSERKAAASLYSGRTAPSFQPSSPETRLEILPVALFDWSLSRLKLNSCILPLVHNIRGTHPH